MKWSLARKLAIAPIRLYQYCISPLFPACCRYYPTCSTYAREAVLTHGVGKGGLLALLRLFRCHPWSAGGYDPVPPDKRSPGGSPVLKKREGTARVPAKRASRAALQRTARIQPVSGEIEHPSWKQNVSSSP